MVYKHKGQVKNVEKLGHGTHTYGRSLRFQK